jgi:hypothetical protein
MKPASIIFIIAIVLLPSLPAGAQGYNRIRAEISVKSKEPGGTQSLTMGEVCYDRNQKQIIYYITFPEKETWISVDTSLYRIREGKLISRTFAPAMAEFSVFHLALSSHLQNYGLNHTNYKAENVTREGDQVITTWVPPVVAKSPLGKIMISARNKQLYGVVFFDPKETILRKQFFEDYLVISGLSFPGKIVQIDIVNGIESYQVTTFRNIKIDEPDNDSKYYFPVSTLR